MTECEKVITELEEAQKILGKVDEPTFWIDYVRNAIYHAVRSLKKQQWISVNDGMPEERESLFAKFKGTSQWRNTMFERMSDDVRVAVTFTDGTRMVRHGYTVDGKWNVEKKVPSCVVTHWMPNPELPEVNDD